MYFNSFLIKAILRKVQINIRKSKLNESNVLIKIEQLTHIPARVHHILSQTLATEDTLNALYSPLPPYTIDFHLINLICAGLTLPFHCNPLEKLTLLTQNGTRICLITASDGLAIQPSPHPLIIPPDSLIVHTDSTWSGDIRPSHTTRNRGPLYCYTWNLLQEETTRLTDIIHGRSMSGEKWELSHPIHTYCPEATTPIWEHIEGTHPSSRLTAAFWGGGIDEEVMMDLPVPPFLRKKCYRALIVRILKEAHKRWKQRNTQLLQSGNLTDYEWTPSKLAHKTPPTSPNKRKRDIQWTNNRLVETRMQRILHDYIHTPIPRPPNTTPQTDTDSGEDSGWTKHIEEVGILEGGAVVGRSGGTGVSAGLTRLLLRYRAG